jgi:hypothetical protein
VFAPVNTILGSSVDELIFGVINIFLSEFAMFSSQVLLTIY